jgi:hypothetical protein
MSVSEADSTGQGSIGEVDWTGSDIGTMVMSDIGNAGDGDVRLSSIGTAGETESIAGAEKSEAISDADGVVKPETMTVDAGSRCISGSSI